MNSRRMSKDGVTTREQAIQHVVESTRYWSSNHGNAGHFPCNKSKSGAFALAVQHVRSQHYMLSQSDIQEAMCRLG